MTDARKPTEATWSMIRRALKQQSLAPTATPCTVLRGELGGLPFELKSAEACERGCWFCEPERAGLPAGQPGSVQARTQDPEPHVAFLRIERRCPRDYPTGIALTWLSDDGVVRPFSQSDTGDIIFASVVSFKKIRALNPSEWGQVDEARPGRFRVEREKLSGHYRPPWLLGWGVDLE
jgi:hypothetical protein